MGRYRVLYPLRRPFVATERPWPRAVLLVTRWPYPLPEFDDTQLREPVP